MGIRKGRRLILLYLDILLLEIIYYIYVVAVLLHIKSRCRSDLRNSLHHLLYISNLIYYCSVVKVYKIF